MTGEQRTGLDDEELDLPLDDPLVMAWFAAHVTELRRSASGQRLLSSYLATGFVVGLAAHTAGYLLRSAVTTEPWRLLADLLYTVGLALWTGAVVVVFLQVVPEAKRRQIKLAVDAYDAIVREKTRPKDAGDPSAR